LTQIIGIAFGGTLAVLLILIWHRSIQKLPLARFFLLTNILLIIFAAGLITRSGHEFIKLGWLPSLSATLYNLNPIVSDISQMGTVLRSLIGYTASPVLIETIVYLAYLGLATFFFEIRSGKSAQTRHAREEIT